MDQKELPRIAGKLRSKYLEMPEEIYRAKGIVIMGKRIKSVIFTTDIAIIRSCNADAVLAVYPFTPQQVISQSIINVAPMPVFVGVGGGITNGVRSAIIAKDAEGGGAEAETAGEGICFRVVRSGCSTRRTEKVGRDAG